MSSAIMETAARFRRMVEELDKASRHARIGEEHFLNKEIPRGCAHALALQGHLNACQRLLDEMAEEHARRSQA